MFAHPEPSLILSRWTCRAFCFMCVMRYVIMHHISDGKPGNSARFISRHSITGKVVQQYISALSTSTPFCLWIHVFILIFGDTPFIHVCRDHLPGLCNRGQVDRVEDLMIKMEKSTAEKKGLRKEYTLLSWGNGGTGKEHVPLSKTLCDETSDMGEIPSIYVSAQRCFAWEDSHVDDFPSKISNDRGFSS